jgi:isopentenyl-diphosphate delta-isomerase
VNVILVNTKDQQVGIMEKLEAHKQGLLHRAFSVFIFNDEGEMLLQRRAAGKYHSSLLWSNACCSHPLPGEDTAVAAQRRLIEEMGFNTPVEKVLDFIYTADVGNELVEYEFDHVFVGYYNGDILINKSEVAEYAFSSLQDIKKDIDQNPANYTAWFRLLFQQVETWWLENNQVQMKEAI